MKKIPLIVILGPTAVGKSDLAVKVAEMINGEIVSADSRQIYKGLNIGTGKITTEEMRGIPHHLLDVIDAREKMTVVRYKELASEAIANIYNRGKIPIVCGGTGFYIENLVDNISLPDVRPDLELRAKLSEMSNEELISILIDMDPEYVNSIDVKNKRKIIRAIEIAKVLGKVPGVERIESKYDVLFIGLNLPTEELKNKINQRLKSRIENGMIDEVKDLYKQGLSYERMDELGLEYRYVSRYLKNEIGIDEMVKKLETEIWHYAKRQMTWFKRDKRINWFTPDEDKIVILKIKEFLNTRHN